MENDSSKNSKELGIYTGSNFFNASEDQLNGAAQAEGVLQSKVKNMDAYGQGDLNSENESEQIGAIGQQKFRYGNHRNKTTRGFERSNIQLALKQKSKESNRYYKSTQVQCWPPEKYFTLFSPGIFLFFSFLKRVSFLFIVLTCVYMFPIIYNYLNGVGFQHAATTLQIVIARMTVGNQSDDGDTQQNTKDKLFIMLPDCICVLIFLVFCIYWSRFCAKAKQQFKLMLKKSSQFTIEVTDFPASLSEQDINKFFSKYGDIAEVAAVKNYEQMIDLSKQAYELSLQIKQKILSRRGEITQSHTQYLTKNQKKVNALLEQLGHIQEHRQKKNIKYYIKFEEESSKTQVLKHYKPYDRFFKFFRKDAPDELKIDGQLPRVKSCETEPAEIIWENIHITSKSRWSRFLLQCILVLLIITLGFIFISTLNITTPPTSYNDVETSQLTLSEVKELNTYSVSYTWCLNKSSFSQAELSFCTTYKDSYKFRLLLSVAITVIILVTKTILKEIMIRIAYFQRYKNRTELSTNVMTNLFVIYISTTVMITFLLQANIFGISFKSFIQLFITSQELLANLTQFKEYSDFDPYWYKDIGYQIWMNWLILSVFPHTLLPFYYAIKQKIGLKMAQRQLLQKNVLKWIQSQEFQIEDHYANILLLIFVGFIFAGGIPFMIPLTLLALASRYLIFKYIFIRFCRIPNYYTDAMNERAKFILNLGLVLHVSISIWMFGVSDIFGEYDRISVLSTPGDESGVMVLVRKLTAHWYLTCILAAVVGCLVFHRIIKTLIQLILNREEKTEVQSGPNQNKNIKLTQVALTESYKIQKNPNYFQILAIMKPEEIKNSAQLNQLFPFWNRGQSQKPQDKS